MPDSATAKILGFLLFVIVASLALAVNGSRSPHHAERINPEQRASQTVGDQKATQKVSPETGGPSATFQRNDETKAAEAEQNGTEFWPSLFGFRFKITDSLLVIFTGFLAWSTWGLHKSTIGLQSAAENQAAITERLFVSDQRPWISVENIAFASGIEWGDGEFVAQISFTVKNIGKTPAINLMINSEVIASPPEDSSQRQTDIAERPYLYRNVGATVFPGQIYTLITSVRMEKESVEASKKYWSAFAEDTKNTKAGVDWILPDLIGDVAYRSIFGDSALMHTGFVRGIRRYSKAAPQNVISEAMGDIPLEELRLSWSFLDPVIT